MTVPFGTSNEIVYLRAWITVCGSRRLDCQHYGILKEKTKESFFPVSDGTMVQIFAFHEREEDLINAQYPDS